MDTLCYNSSDPVAVNATVLFDFDIDNMNLWTRADPTVPLPPCPSSSPPGDAQCTVCRDHIVFAVCRKLADGVKMTMEAGIQQVTVLQSECPTMLSDGQLHSALLFLFLILFLILLLFIGGVGACVLWRRSMSNQQSERRTDAHPETGYNKCV